MIKREAVKSDLSALLELYGQLNSKPILKINERVESVFEEILSEKNQRILIIEVDGRPVSTCGYNSNDKTAFMQWL